MKHVNSDGLGWLVGASEEVLQGAHKRERKPMLRFTLARALSKRFSN